MARGNQGSQFYLLEFYDIQNTDTPTQAVNKCCTIFSSAPTCSRIPGHARLVLAPGNNRIITRQQIYRLLQSPLTRNDQHLASTRRVYKYPSYTYVLYTYLVHVRCCGQMKSFSSIVKQNPALKQSTKATQLVVNGNDLCKCT